MKKLILCFICIFMLSGCKKDSMENIQIYTTTYPIEYITKKLYGEYSNISSVYPNEVIDLSDKLLSDYSKGNLFVYNGLSNEKDYAVKMINKNKDLMIVDATMGMEIENGIEELWINPSNFLMLCLNIKNGMKEYITNSFLKRKIDENYDNIYLEISELDAEIKLLVENADDNNILVSNNVFNFLSKYNVNILSLDEDNTLNDKLINDIKSEIENENIKYIIMLPDDVLSDEANKLINNYNIEKLYFNPLTTLSEEDTNNGEDFISIMQENLNVLKKELYSESE